MTHIADEKRCKGKQVVEIPLGHKDYQPEGYEITKSTLNEVQFQ